MEVLRILQVAVGIGLVIFVHEAGHFIAARLCGVRVHVFSLGFGPKLLGWRRGPTLYQIAAVPLGGYVKMAGEEGDSSVPGPGDLRSKSVPQRFFIFSGGVLMNVAFALVVFPIVLMSGVPFSSPVIGAAVPGGPAWHARIEAGTRVLAINGEPVISFLNIGEKVALGSRDSVHFELQGPGDASPREVTLKPRYREREGFLSIDVVPASDPQRRLRVDPDSPAARAGLRDGDRLVGTESGLEGLTLEERVGDEMERAHPVTLIVQRGDERVRAVIEPGQGPDSGSKLFGFSPPVNRVADLREDNADLVALGLRDEDRLATVGGRAILRSGDLERALSEARGPVTWVVSRNGRSVELRQPELPRERALQLARDVAVTQDEESTTLVLTPGAPAAAQGIRDGDRTLRIDKVAVSAWKELQEITRSAAKDDRSLRFTVERQGGGGDAAGQIHEIEARAQPWSPPYYGFSLQDDQYVYQAPNAAAALRIGFKSSMQTMSDVWSMLKRIAQGDVSSKNIGGIIAIGAVSYSFSSEGLAKLLFFLCILSLNLAFINVLPIPVLDGGHLLFLLIEGIKGSPVSERVQGYSQMVGLVLIVSLMIFVTYNDLMRVVFNQ